ncbi:MAG: isoprenylcysteine carboxylmethyltransferase family protein [Chitinophagaceae bacterium]|nr:MAG: isoprenylcysteine carboxylmethyltransferase family protein [Chitinophagaceae bacterium]
MHLNNAIGLHGRVGNFGISKTNKMKTFLTLYLPLFLIGFIVLVFVVPTIRVYRQTGINPFRFKTNHDQAHDYIGGSMKVFIGVLLFTALLYAISPSAYSYLAPFGYLESGEIKIAGLIMGHLALVGIIVAQQQMKQSWRIGIDYDHETKLVTAGLFSVSRNPIFLFLLIALAGLFLVIPNAVTFAVLCAAYIVLQVTMRMEEAFLARQHGQIYLDYKNKVRRLI